MTRRASVLSVLKVTLALGVAAAAGSAGCHIDLGGIGGDSPTGGGSGGRRGADAGSGGAPGSGGAGIGRGTGGGEVMRGTGGGEVMRGTGGSVVMRGTGGSEVMRGTGGSTVMRGSGGAPGTGGSGGTSNTDGGQAGSGGGGPVMDGGKGDSGSGRCSGENPAQACRAPGSCIPSSCSCSDSGGWVCTRDCGGGHDCADGGASSDGATGPVCGDTVCPAGKICCNPSCGVCTGPDEGCLLVECTPVSGTCDTDDDCRPTADYCTGCDCRALGKGGHLPACPGPGVRCLSDPCSGRSAICSGGRCAIVEPRVSLPSP